ncbi:hypothetical protein T05_14736 [Trichinella murrelli]|uniref:Uncharacterized protein n=1 Tax=Trichinella murrelli TaxID=144512 RepID=A0A0V0T665_9BILA|nr:hypothetical protein T05_14736 [Trichinella murrelli]
MTSLGGMCSTSPSLAHRTSSHMLVELAAYRITQQVPHDDAIVRCRYTVSAEEVFRLLQTLRAIYLLTRHPMLRAALFGGGWFVAPIWLLSQSSLGDDASTVSPVLQRPPPIHHCKSQEQTTTIASAVDNKRTTVTLSRSSSIYLFKTFVNVSNADSVVDVGEPACQE